MVAMARLIFSLTLILTFLLLGVSLVMLHVAQIQPHYTLAYVSYENRVGDIMVYDLETKSERNLTQHTVDNYNAVWSPDGAI